MLKNGSEIQKDYFVWLDKVKGIRPDQMQGAVRNNGLHFTVGKNAYSYKIPKQEGDVLTYNNDSQSLFTVSDDGGYWKVTLNDNHR